MRDLWDDRAERALIGAMLHRWDLWDDARRLLRAEEFWSERHRVIWRACEAAAADGLPLDPTSVALVLELQGKLKAAGGDAYLLELAADVGSALTPEHLDRYARSIRRWASARHLRAVCERCTTETESLATATEAEEWAELREREISAALAPLRRPTGLIRGEQPISETAQRTLARLDAPAQHDEVLCETGIPEIDELGLLPSFTVLASRTGHGKSTLLATLARILCGRGKRLYVVQAEDTAETLLYRLVTQATGISVRRVADIVSGRHRHPVGDATDAGLIRAALAEIRSWPLTVNDDPGPSAERIRLQLREQARRGCDLAIVDHALELARSRTVDERQSLDRSIRMLRDAALETGIPLILATQIHRMGEGPPRPPRLSNLKGTGSFEECARLVILLHRPDADRPDDADMAERPRRPEPIRVEVAKASNGRCGSRWMMFDVDRMWVRQTDATESAMIRTTRGDPAAMDEAWRSMPGSRPRPVSPVWRGAI